MSTKVQSLLPRYHQESYHWALVLCRHNRDLAHDVLQTAYEKALNKGYQYKEQASFKTWLFAIIKNTAYDMQQAGKLQIMEVLPDSADEGHTPEQTQAANTSQLLQQLLGRLSAMQRKTLQLCFYHNHTLEESAQILGISVGSARTHYARGKTKLKALIEQHQLKDQLL